MHSGFVLGQSEEDFFSGASMPRNRELMKIFRIPEHFIRVAFPFTESPNENAPKNQAKTGGGTVNGTVNGTVREKIKDLLRKAPESTYVDIAETTELSRRTVARLISEMAENGEIVREGSDKKGTWVVLK